MKKLIDYMPFLKKQEGDVGIEIEVEGVNLPREVAGWRVEEDGSLRGENCEYVLPRPLPQDRIRTALKRLSVDMRQSGATVLDTGYAGIHIHINAQQLTVTQVCTFAFLYYAIEDLCLHFCGEDRKGNLFCLSAGVAPYPLKALEEALHHTDFRHLRNDKLRYASLNWKALSEYGSLEFRGMRSTLDIEVIEAWVGLLLELRKTAIEIDNPQRVVEMYSELRGEGFVKAVLPTYHAVLQYDGDVNRAVERGVRSIQKVAYTVDWERFKKEQPEPEKKPERFDAKLAAAGFEQFMELQRKQRAERQGVFGEIENRVRPKPAVAWFPEPVIEPEEDI